MDKLFVVIPTYNEQDNIDQVVEQWHEVVVKTGVESRLVIVDDGSKDSTYTKLLALKNEFPQLIPITKENSGHGGTVLYAYDYALKNGADYVFQTDSDGQTLPNEFWRFWDKRESYDVQIGYRKGREDGFSRKVVTKVLKLVLLLQFRLRITDANAPFRLMTSEGLAKLLPQIPKDYNLSNVLLTVLYEKNKYRIRYLPITFRPRQGGINSINLPKIFKIGIKAVKDFASLKKAFRDSAGGTN
jgi:glycosyltransferase involved in cell wall biosynthesis